MDDLKRGKFKNMKEVYSKKRKATLMRGIMQRESQISKVEKSQTDYAMQNKEAQGYTLAEQEEYMNYLQEQFLNGKITKRNIEKIREKLYKYPDKVQSALFISELYYMLTEEKEVAIDELDKYLETLDKSDEAYKIIEDRISEFRKRIDTKSYVELHEKEKQNKEQKEWQEQEKYMDEVQRKFEAGELDKHKVTMATRKLEQFHNKGRAMKLALTMYKKYYDKQGLEILVYAYSQVDDWNDDEKQFLADIVKDETKERVTIEKQKKLKLRQRNIDSKKYKKELEVSKIMELLKQGKTVMDVFNQMHVPVKSIVKVRDRLLTQDEEYRKKHNEDVELVKLFLHDGYKVEQVYKLIEGNVSVNQILEIKSKEGIINKRGRKPKNLIEDYQK